MFQPPPMPMHWKRAHDLSCEFMSGMDAEFGIWDG